MIVDASVAFKWLVLEEGSPAAIDLLGRSPLSAPVLIQAEVGNALWKKSRRGELGSDPQLAVLMDQLAALVDLVDETSMIARALQMSIDLDHPVYDCIYLALAEASDERLVTADQRFITKLSGHPLGARIVGLAA